jgi:hypothetical protein
VQWFYLGVLRLSPGGERLVHDELILCSIIAKATAMSLRFPKKCSQSLADA